MIIGLVGVMLLVLSYITLSSKTYSFYFPYISLAANFILTIHSYLIKDLPWLLASIIIMIFLIITLFKRSGREKLK